jgi:hypothetical protein
MTVRSIPAEKLPVGSAFSKLLICLAERTDADALRLAEEKCAALPQIEHTLRLRVKAGVGALSTSAGLPIGELSRELVLLLRERSSAMQIIQRCRRVPFKVAVARELGAGTGAGWRGEALPAPTVASMFDTLKLPYAVIDTITAATRESFRFGAVTERALRESVVNGVARYLDDRALDPSVSAGTSSPASLTNAAAAISSSGATASAIITDLVSMLEALETPATGAVWVMRRKTFVHIAAALASVGLAVSPDALFTLPVLIGNGPQQIALIDADAVLVAFDEDAIGIETSSIASLEMSDAPTQDGTTGGGASMVSLWQTGMLGIKASLPINWQHAQFNGGSPDQPSGAVYMPVNY